MEGTLTFGDFIKEAEMFQYSQENFNLIKEASELNLMALYIENQSFMIDNKENIETMTEGFLMESASENAYESVLQEYQEKAGTFGKNIAERFKRIWVTFVAFLKKMLAKVKKIQSDTEKLVSDLDVKFQEITPSDLQKINNVVDRAAKDSGIVLHENQRALNAKNNKSKFFLQIKNDGVRRKLESVLVNGLVHVEIGSDKWAFDQNQITEFMNKIVDDAYVVKNISKIRKMMDSYQATNIKKGIWIGSDSGELEQWIQTLEEYRDTKANRSIVTDTDSDLYKSINPVFSDAMKVCADTIKVYNGVMSYRMKICIGLSQILKK